MTNLILSNIMAIIWYWLILHYVRELFFVSSFEFQSIHHEINRSSNHSIKNSSNQSLTHLSIQPSIYLTNHPSKHQSNQPIIQSIIQSTIHQSIHPFKPIHAYQVFHLPLQPRISPPLGSIRVEVERQQVRMRGG